MYEAGSLKIKVDIPGQERRPNVIDKPITLDLVINYIMAQGYDPYVSQQLVQQVRKYPHQALTKFVGTIPNRIGKILAARRKQEVRFTDLNEAVEKPTQEMEDTHSVPEGEEHDYKESFKAAIKRGEDDF